MVDNWKSSSSLFAPLCPCNVLCYAHILLKKQRQVIQVVWAYNSVDKGIKNSDIYDSQLVTYTALENNGELTD